MKVAYKRWISMSFALLFALTLLAPLNVSAEENIKHSNVDYDASFRDATQIFIGNKLPVKWEVGDVYFLHYTVTKLESDETNQSGVMVTEAPKDVYPYLKGGMHYQNNLSICEEGWTYFFRFEVTEDGLQYIAGKANETESGYIQFPFTTGEITTPGTYFGVWINGTTGGKLTAELNHIRCYDEKGNDLGIIAPKASKIKISDMNPLDVNHRYSFSVEDVACLAFGSAKYTEAEAIMLEYTVSNVTAKNVTQSGAEFTNAPTAYFPHGNDMGYLNYDFNKAENPTNLLSEGASYLVRFVKDEETFDVLVKRTMPNGAVDYFSFANYYGTYDSVFGYVAMWIGQECEVTADFTDVKCYDDEGNNLGIQTNKNVAVTHSGELEDYTQCLAAYYCREKDSMMVLNENSNIICKDVAQDSTTSGSYAIEDGVLSITVEEETNEYEYAYEWFRDDEGNKYLRLRDNKVTFMSQREGGTEIASGKITAATEYKVARPENPTGGNGNFVCWIDRDGNEYEFNRIETESITLYASWDGEPDWQVLSGFSTYGKTIAWIVSGVLCAALITGTTVVSVKKIRKGKKGADES